MARQLFSDGPYIDPPVASGAALVATGAENLWTGATFTPIFANDPKAGKIFHLVAGGLISTALLPGNLTLNPQYGATSLGSSGAQNPPGLLANAPWTLEMYLVFRTIGAAGANSTCVATGAFTAGAFSMAFGGTPASVDATINSSLSISKTLTVAGSMTTQFAFLHSLN